MSDFPSLPPPRCAVLVNQPNDNKRDMKKGYSQSVCLCVVPGINLAINMCVCVSPLPSLPLSHHLLASPFLFLNKRNPPNIVSNVPVMVVLMYMVRQQ
jgi:hypothetical protein